MKFQLQKKFSKNHISELRYFHQMFRAEKEGFWTFMDLNQFIR